MQTIELILLSLSFIAIAIGTLRLNKVLVTLDEKAAKDEEDRHEREINNIDGKA